MSGALTSPSQTISSPAVFLAPYMCLRSSLILLHNFIFLFKVFNNIFLNQSFQVFQLAWLLVDGHLSKMFCWLALMFNWKSNLKVKLVEVTLMARSAVYRGMRSEIFNKVKSVWCLMADRDYCLLVRPCQYKNNNIRRWWSLLPQDHHISFFIFFPQQLDNIVSSEVEYLGI